MLVDGFHHRTQEHQELHVGVGLVLRIKQVDSGIGADRPVVVLARPIHPGERLLVHQAHEAMVWGGGTQDMHGEHLVVDRDVGVFEHRCDFVLTGGHFVVSGHRRNAKLHELAFDIIHVGQHAFGDGAEVVVVELMAFRAVRPKQGATAEPQVFPVFHEAARRPRSILVRCPGWCAPGSRLRRCRRSSGSAWLDRFDGAEERGFEVQSLSCVGDEDGRDAERAATAAREDERGTGCVPSGVATGFEGLSGPTRGEGGSIGFTEGQVVAGKSRSGGAISEGVQEGVVLLGGGAGQRGEPVAIVGRAVFEPPILSWPGRRHQRWKGRAFRLWQWSEPGSWPLGGKRLAISSVLNVRWPKNAEGSMLVDVSVVMCFSCKWSHLGEFLLGEKCHPRGFCKSVREQPSNRVVSTHVTDDRPHFGRRVGWHRVIYTQFSVSLPAWPARCSVLARMRSLRQLDLRRFGGV